MVVDYRYSWHNGVLVKIDPDGNIISPAHLEPVSRRETSQTTCPVTSVTHSQPNLAAMEQLPAQAATIASETLQIIDENDPCELQSLEKLILTKDDLERRDREAVAYSKALLVEGDTLVYITYPGESKCFDSTGFEISAAPHRVHSSRLLATGSKIFAKLLNSTNQYRILRRKKLVGNLPTGIKYVLDLTPPDEGDEAVQLTSELSCSLGIRLWYTAAQRCGISHSLVGGEDEIMDPRKVASYGTTTADALSNAAEYAADPLTSISNQATDVSNSPTSWEFIEAARQRREIADAVRMSLEELSKSEARKAGKNYTANVPEYCPIRHRAGIGRLLRVLEGKDPRLDSAPKVWTLFVLAKYFDCTSAVVDWIVSWVIADPNTQFIEILPEVSCRMAFGLNNQMICRAAFSILVSEEALSLASREAGRVDADRNGTNQFGRLREDVDEDLRTRIEYASKNFASRVCNTFEALAEEEMTWVTQMPEYQKLRIFKNTVLSYVGDAEQAKKWLSAIDQLSFNIRKYVRSRIIASLGSSLTTDLVNTANSHRRAERYTNVDVLNKPGSAFSLLYDKLVDKERIFTRFFWLFLLYTDFPIWLHGERPSDSDPKFSDAYVSGVRPSISTLLAVQRQLNESIIEAIQAGLFNSGIIPPETRPDHTESSSSRAYKTHGNSHLYEVTARLNDVEARQIMQSWNPFSVFKSESAPLKVHATDNDDWNDSITSDQWKIDGIKSMNGVKWDAWTTNDGANDTQPLISGDARGLNNITRDVSHGVNGADLEKMDFDKYLAQHHLLNQQSGPERTAISEKGFPFIKSNLPLRPKAQATTSAAHDSVIRFDKKEQAIPQKFESSKSQALKAPIWTPDKTPSTGQARDKKQPQWNAESYLSRILRETQAEKPLPKNYSNICPISKPAPKLSIPGDDRIPGLSPLFNLSRFFVEAKDHIRGIATSMLDQREMGFDVALTDTLLCLGPEEFKYLPLWAGGDDDGSGGVFDDTIPFPLAGPNGPGPSFHTGFSTASAASSEFDSMSDRTAFNTSVAVEDGFSDHIDRRIVAADDDFHSETFSEDSETYDRKGKGVDRSGFFTSAPASEAAFSVTDTASGSLPDIDTPDESSFEIDYEEEHSDADTTIGQVDDDDDVDAWDGGDAESFDFGDSDEEMANV